MAANTSVEQDPKEKILAGLKLPKPFIPIGIDVGQVKDPTTIVVGEARQRFSGRWQHLPEDFSNKGYRAAQDTPILETLFQVRFVSRIPLNTEYPVVALMLARLLDNEQLRGKRRVVRIDITGVGRPIYDMLVAEVRRLPEHRLITCLPITFTHGDHYKRDTGVLGKAFGVSRAQSLLQRSLIKVPTSGPFLSEILAMIEEMKIYKIKINDKGNDTYGAFEVGTHDDLATALILMALEDAIANTVTIGPKIR